MIQVESLKKSYGDFQALKGISFSSKKGEVLALLGPNGAGKTTTMKIITAFLAASSGKVLINGDKAGVETQNLIGYLPENTPLYQDLNVYEHLEFAAKIRGLEGAKLKSAIKKAVAACSLEEKLYFEVSELSKGYKQRVALAQAIVHDPKILILDEPTTGLDPNQIIEIRDLIKKLGETKTIILSTHIMQEVEAVADRVVVINKGEIVAQGSPKELMKGNTTSAHSYRVVVQGTQKTVIDALKKVKGVSSVKKTETVERGVAAYEVLAESDIRREINKAIVKADLDLYELKEDQRSMEDVFIQLTK